MNIIEEIQSDREQARRLGDTNADICFLALADQAGNASVRTLVLRDIEDRSFRLFINKTSPKYRLLTHGATFEMLLWYTTMQKQYRLSGEFRELEREVIETNWHRRPIPSKYLDYYYENHSPQSSVVSSRTELKSSIDALKQKHDPDDMTTPSNAVGVELVATRIESLNLAMEDRLHDRQIHTFENDNWQSQILVP